MKRDFLKELWALTGEIGCEAERNEDELLGEVYIKLADIIDFMYESDKKRCRKICADILDKENETKGQVVHIRLDEALEASLTEISKSLKLPLSTTMKFLVNEILKEKYSAIIK